jgi:hypothetical protein
MRTKFLSMARAALSLALMVMAGASIAQDREAPQVTADRDGRTQVVVDGDCVVDFNARGERTRNSADCRDGQLRRAERADDRYREELAGSDRGPRVSMQADGRAQLSLGRDCEVTYDREGHRQTWDSRCRAEQLARADSAFAEFVREREPKMTVQRDGQLRVDVGRDCAVSYDAEGRRRAQGPGCGNAEIAGADRAVAAYLREREPKMTVQRDGQLRVDVGRDCAIGYDADGRRRAQGPGCGGVEIGRADRAVAAYLREREPRVTMRNGGQARVAVGRDCEVNYGRDGSRRGSTQGCSGSDVALADRSMAAYRQQHSLDLGQRPGVVTSIPGTGGRGDERPGSGKGDVKTLANGEGTVTFSNGCVVTYASDGRRLGGMRICNPGQVGRADELMATYLQLKRAPSGGS